MSEKKNSLEEKRILQKKLQWYTLEAEEGEFNATEVEAMLERLDNSAISANKCILQQPAPNVNTIFRII